MPHYKLIYFPIRGRVEPIRLMLAAANVPYEEVLIERADWPNHKNEMPFGQVPVMEIDGVRIAQTNAIGRYIAREHGLAGKTNLENARIDMLIDGMQDVRNAARPVNIPRFAGDMEKSNAAWKAYRDEFVMPFLHRFTAFLKEAGPGGWFVGDSMTWADIVIADYVERVDSLYESGIMNAFPELKKHQERVYQNPGIAKRIASRPDWNM